MPTRLTAPFGRWDDFAADLTAHPLDDWFELELLDRLNALAQITPHDPERAVLAHGDFDTSHIFATSGRYTGVIDFGEIRGAEATFDLGHVALHIPEALPFIVQGYQSVSPLPQDIGLQIAASAIRIGWFRLTQSSARFNPPYAAQLVDGMTRLTLHV